MTDVRDFGAVGDDTTDETAFAEVNRRGLCIEAQSWSARGSLGGSRWDDCHHRTDRRHCLECSRAGRYQVESGAEEGTRTLTPLSWQRILSPRRLPFRHLGMGVRLATKYRRTKAISYRAAAGLAVEPRSLMRVIYNGATLPRPEPP